jgi:hypothetical protein
VSLINERMAFRIRMPEEVRLGRLAPKTVLLRPQSSRRRSRGPPPPASLATARSFRERLTRSVVIPEQWRGSGALPAYSESKGLASMGGFRGRDSSLESRREGSLPGRAAKIPDIAASLPLSFLRIEDRRRSCFGDQCEFRARWLIALAESSSLGLAGEGGIGGWTSSNCCRESGGWLPCLIG